MPALFCKKCSAKVEDVGGYCLLGHPLFEENDLIQEIRAEVNAAFERAKVSIETGVPVDPEPKSKEPSAPTPTAIRELAAENGADPDPDTALPSAFQALADENVPDPLNEAEIVERRRARATAAWRRLQERPVTSKDPISAFAPSPRMDWGPEDSKLKRWSDQKRLKTETA